MSALTRLFVLSTLVSCFSLAATAADLPLDRVQPRSVEQVSGDRAAGMALLSQNPDMGYTLTAGTKTVIVTLSKITNLDSISFRNNGAKGDVVISTSNTKLPANSARWAVMGKHELSGETVSAKVGPTDAKYVKLTFNVTEAGRLADLGIYAARSFAFAQVESGDKTMLDTKDMGSGKDFKDMPEEGPESPAEGPPSPLPPPPPFNFVPVIVPTSP